MTRTKSRYAGVTVAKPKVRRASTFSARLIVRAAARNARFGRVECPPEHGPLPMCSAGGPRSERWVNAPAGAVLSLTISKRLFSGFGGMCNGAGAARDRDVRAVPSTVTAVGIPVGVKESVC